MRAFPPHPNEGLGDPWRCISDAEERGNRCPSHTVPVFLRDTVPRLSFNTGSASTSQGQEWAGQGLPEGKGLQLLEMEDSTCSTPALGQKSLIHLNNPLCLMA